MLLAIDAGNTNTVFAVYEGDALRGEWRAATVVNRTADEMGIWLDQLMGLESLSRTAVKGAIIACVVPALLFTLKTLCRRYFGCDPMIIGEAGIDLGIKALVEHPEEVGADRLVNAVAAHERFGGPLIILDFGTATTFDVVDGDGNYRGGAIAPGINLSLAALHQAAAQLPRIAVARPAQVIGRSTVPAMQSGVFWGYVGLVEGLVARIQAELGEPMRVIATGGLAPLFADSTAVIEHVDQELTLRGLLSIHRRSGGSAA